MAKTGSKTRRGGSAKNLTGSKGSSTQSKRNGGGGDAKTNGMTSGEKRGAARGAAPNPVKD